IHYRLKMNDNDYWTMNIDTIHRTILWYDWQLLQEQRPVPLKKVLYILPSRNEPYLPIQLPDSVYCCCIHLLKTHSKVLVPMKSFPRSSSDSDSFAVSRLTRRNWNNLSESVQPFLSWSSQQ